MSLSESDTRAKLIDPALHKRGWTEDLIRREETAGTVGIVNGEGKEIEDAVYDLKTVNPLRKPEIDERTPEQLFDIIEAKGKEIAEALATLRRS